MNKLPLLAIIAVISSCASYKEIKIASPDFYALKEGDVVWVYTGTVSRSRVIFKSIKDDSVYTNERSYAIDSVSRILKESPSPATTGVLVGSLLTALWIGTIAAFAAAFSIYAKIFWIF